MATATEYALMAAAAYDSTRGDINKIPFPAEWGWRELAGFSHRTSGSGFEGAAYVSTDGKEIVIAFAGTFELIDWFSANFPLVAGGYSPQLSEAAFYYPRVKAAHRNSTIGCRERTFGAQCTKVRAALGKCPGGIRE